MVTIFAAVFFPVIVAASTLAASICEPSCSGNQTCPFGRCIPDAKGVKWEKFGKGPPKDCTPMMDPQNRPPSGIEKWFTKDIFDDLFPKANLGWGPDSCFPYNYESFVMAARYFPRFGTESPNNGYTPEQNYRRDLAAFFAHGIQETGENNADLYRIYPEQEKADACFYRGGFFNWFEGGPVSQFVPNGGLDPSDGTKCRFQGRYCIHDRENNYFFPCYNDTVKPGDKGFHYKGCYFGRGAIQLSFNFNYGQFQHWLAKQNLTIDVLNEPNLIITHRSPPLAILASLWFYMTPQPPKPAMHDIILGNWNPGTENVAAGYQGPIFGPTSLVINNECTGEDADPPGGGGENRRIRAFRWFLSYFNAPVEDDKLLSCNNMPQPFDQIRHFLSWQPDWSETWKKEPCQCAPAEFGGTIPYYQAGYYPEWTQALNEENRQLCIDSLYKAPEVHYLNANTSKCLTVPRV